MISHKDMIEIAEVVAKRFTIIENEINNLTSLVDKLTIQNKELAQRLAKLEKEPVVNNHYHYDNSPRWPIPKTPLPSDYPNPYIVTCGGSNSNA